jgi:ubiquinone biosynthesis accessory factor UbiJ
MMFIGPLNAYLSRSLDRSPRARELCSALAGRKLRLVIGGYPEPVWIVAAVDSLQVAHALSAEAAADVTVSGSPVGLLALTGEVSDEVFARSGVSVSGDEQLARQFLELARFLRPDLETTLGHLVGRIPSHLATRALGALGSWGRAARASLVRNTADFLAHESRDLVPRAEAESYLGGVEALRAQLTRAEVRVARLAEQLAGLEPPSPVPPPGGA